MHLHMPESNDANKCNPLNTPEYNTKFTKNTEEYLRHENHFLQTS